ncbi:hypothetical protein CISIN_1g041009mg [Citrus sinensis]|uniref:PGG domain-containing protein n=1 Tax=Citrus sinensis TaxID=2711 RepID=A0A067DL42_CITSI|nr:hypothetical protein CISIN_1g041009mg [Citrus sinensis]
MAGSVNTLLELRQQDPLIVERPTVNCLSETPLHVAALLGHEDFAKEILRQKPRIAEELDSRKSSALHIASQKGYVGIVKALLQVIPDKCSDTDVDGRNPLHLAAMRGHIDVLEELARAKPDAASARLIWGETILHLCVKHNQLEALKFLLENMGDSELLNAKDDYGMTILHLAVADKQIEAIKLLTTSTAIEVNAVTANGFTAWDILAQSKRDTKDWDIGELLRRAGAISAQDLQLPANELAVIQTNSVTSHENNQKHEGKKDLKGTPWNLDDWLEKKRNAAMVVASVISTMGFQAAVDPPQSPQLAASSFVVWNTIGFLASLSLILLLIIDLPINRILFAWILAWIMSLAIVAMAITYIVSIALIGDPNSSYSNNTTSAVLVWMAAVGIVSALVHISRLMVMMIKRMRKSIRRLSHIQAQDGRDYEPPIASVL